MSSNVLVAKITEGRHLEHHDGDWWDIHIDNMLSSEVEMGQFLAGLVRYLKPCLVVETGCASGHTTRFLAAACAENLKGKVISCDTDEMAINSAREYCGLMPVEFRNCSSLDLPELSKADLVFSDSGYAVRILEFAHVKPGCTFVVHDIVAMPKLAEFVVKNGGLNFSKGRGFGIIQKK